VLLVVIPDVIIVGALDNGAVLLIATVVVGTENPVVVVDIIDGTVGIFVISGFAVVAIGAARILESVLFPNEDVVTADVVVDIG
jgi:hypothetical protein